MKLDILTPSRQLVSEEEILDLVLTTSEGEVQILQEHASMLGTLYPGRFSYETKNGEQISGAISTGFFRVDSDRVTVMAETLELSHEIDTERARIAQLRAEKNLVEKELNQENFDKYQLKLQRALIRQHVAGKTVH